jgi:hypothetical protein
MEQRFEQQPYWRAYSINFAPYRQELVRLNLIHFPIHESKLLLLCHAFKYPILTLFESFVYYTCLVLFRITNSSEASPAFGPQQVN